MLQPQGTHMTRVQTGFCGMRCLQERTFLTHPPPPRPTRVDFPNTYVIVSAKEKDALNVTLSSCINSTNVHLCNYCTKIFVIVVNTCLCRRSVDNKAVILSYPILLLLQYASTHFHIWGGERKGGKSVFLSATTMALSSMH